MAPVPVLPTTWPGTTGPVPVSDGAVTWTPVDPAVAPGVPKVIVIAATCGASPVLTVGSLGTW